MPENVLPSINHIKQNVRSGLWLISTNYKEKNSTTCSAVKRVRYLFDAEYHMLRIMSPCHHVTMSSWYPASKISADPLCGRACGELHQRCSTYRIMYVCIHIYHSFKFDLNKYTLFSCYRSFATVLLTYFLCFVSCCHITSHIYIQPCYHMYESHLLSRIVIQPYGHIAK